MSAALWPFVPERLVVLAVLVLLVLELDSPDFPVAALDFSFTLLLSSFNTRSSFDDLPCTRRMDMASRDIRTIMFSRVALSSVSAAAAAARVVILRHRSRTGICGHDAVYHTSHGFGVCSFVVLSCRGPDGQYFATRQGYHRFCER